MPAIASQTPPMPLPRLRRLAAPVAVAIAGMLVLGACGLGGGDANTVRVYSGRQYDVEQAFAQFTEDTGIEVEFQFGNDAELRERIAAEGENTPADVFISVDAGNLAKAADQGLFQPIDDPVLTEAVPPALRDPQNRWFGLSIRARSIAYNPAKVDPSELSTYADLADPKWKGRLCLRNSSNVYTQSLVAALIADEGEEEARRIVSGWAANAEIMDSDVMILDAVAAGQCDVAITNHYYLARKYAEDPDYGVRMFWADQAGKGVHVNVSGAGVTTYAKKPELGKQLIQWLATTGQSAFVSGNHEYPVNPTVAPDDLLVDRFGTDFLRNPMSAETFGSLNAEAVALMDEAGYR
jgi:iron(III) transport system substrate-binding protein